ncbi:ABC transporter permease [Porcipelethomonas sp.]|uniref:ABC transporter permease n=1 Tax=Porcipelethomonas sp. TaxID=2981675 RepID=UPI003EF40B28
MAKKFSLGLTDIIAEHKGQLKKIWMLAVNDLVKKYKGAVMGPLWAIIKPTFTLFILWFAFTVGIRGSGMVSGYPRFIFMLSGYIPWFFISEVIVGGSRSIRQNSQFVTKLSFPVSNIMTFCMLSSLIIHLGMCVIMYIILICNGYGPSVYNLQIFYYMPLMFLFFLVLSWATAPLSAFSRDFENLINSLITGLFWLSGIFWDTYDVSNPILKRLMYFNPINYFINGYRKTFLYDISIFDKNYTTELVVFYAEFILLIFIGSHFYKKLRKILPDIL